MGAAAREHDGVHLVDEIAGIEEIGFTRPWRGAADVDTRDRARFSEDHGAAGRPLGERVLSDLDTGDRGEAFACSSRLLRRREQRERRA